MFKIFILQLAIKLTFGYFNTITNIKINKINNRFMKTCYPEEDEFNNKKNFNQINNNLLLNKNNYTLIWYDCPNCKELLNNLELLKLNNIYIDGGYYFYDTTYRYSKYNTPLFYKNDVFIGDNLFDIYQEIYSNI
jgi:hypothetical protein